MAKAVIPPFFPARVIAVMIIPADTTPVKIEDKATAVGIPSKNAPMAPVHAPVPGSGIPTNAARDAHCFSIDPTPRLADFFLSARKNRRHEFLQLVISQKKQQRNNGGHISKNANRKHFRNRQTHPNSDRNCTAKLHHGKSGYQSKHCKVGETK
mmetsp:Transcript_23107/g.47842  ORF Transcript_23107/g.47842 Transcript_23107/m.47842 type:complete len:154 (+) Transcript_23107:227-688(+)